MRSPIRLHGTGLSQLNTGTSPVYCTYYIAVSVMQWNETGRRKEHILQYPVVMCRPDVWHNFSVYMRHSSSSPPPYFTYINAPCLFRSIGFHQIYKFILNLSLCKAATITTGSSNQYRSQWPISKDNASNPAKWTHPWPPHTGTKVNSSLPHSTDLKNHQQWQLQWLCGDL